MLKKLISIVGILAVLANHPAVAAFAIFQASTAPVVAPCTNTQISSTPLSEFVASSTVNGSNAANADGSTGFTATNYSVLMTTLSFPASCTYTFTVPAYMTANPGVTNQNAVAVIMDGRPIHATAQPDANYWNQFVINSSPVQNYTFTIPVRAGTHNISIGLCVNQNAALVAATQGVHADRLIVTQTSTAFPTEPAGTVDPYQYPTSALGFPKSAIGSGAIWSSGSTGPDTSLQSGSQVINMNNGFAAPFNQGTSANAGTVKVTNNVNTYNDFNSTNPHAIAQMPNPVNIASGSDGQCAMADASNARYLWYGTDSCSFTAPGTLTLGNGYFFDSYDLNPAIDQQAAGEIGYIRVRELITDGVIQHTLLLGMTYVQMSQPQDTMNGVGWPVDTNDFPCAAESGNCTGNVVPGSLIGIPSSVNCSGLGLSSPGVILCVALQNYGAIQNIQAGSPSSPQNTLYAEDSSNSTYVTAITSMATDWGTLKSSLRIMTNNTSANFNAGSPTFAKGGGTPRVAQQAGIQQGLPAINPSPPAPVMTSIVSAFSYFNNSGQALTTSVNLNVGDTAVLLSWQTNATNGTFSTVTLSNGTNTTNCSVTQSAANTTNATVMIASCVNLANSYPAGSTLTVSGSFNGGTWSGDAWKASTSAAGGVDLTAQNGTNASGFSMSLSTGTLAQTGDLVVGILGGVVGGTFGTVTEIINGSSGVQELGDGGHVWAAAAIAPATSATYAPTWTNFGSPTTSSAALVTLKRP